MQTLFLEPIIPQGEHLMKMTKRTLLMLLSILIHIPFASKVVAEAEPDVQVQASNLIQAFSGELKSNLQKAIKEGGLINGIEVCSIKAPEIAAKNSQNNWQVKRTSLLVRNPLNKPTAAELKVLQAFESGKAGGKAIEELRYYRVEDQGKQRVHHLMKAIPTQALCLACHGAHLSKDLQDVLRERYPEDQATGFKEGDIRGAFSLIYTEQK